MKNFKGSFITGLVVLMPLGVTFVVVKFLLEKVGQPASSLFFGTWNHLLDHRWVEVIASTLSIFIVIAIITAFGWLSKFVLGKAVLRITEHFIQNIPFISTVYNTVKQIVDTLGKNKQAVFQRAVLVHFPNKDMYSIGFLTNRSADETQIKTQKMFYNVFIPTTPNPTSGFLVMVPEDQVITLDMSVGDAVKLIISGGAVTPELSQQKPQA